ncbi:MAG TPA: carbamate kinase [Gammaproteobacteria bacterium]|nr:carbamate kinase [Gammaproteobacteria bacterium]
MRIVLALGGNAILHKNEPLTAEKQLDNIKIAAAQIAQLAYYHQLIITHGNGPQIGLLELQNHAYHATEAYPLDILGAETQGMLGYLLEQEVANGLCNTHKVSTLITRVVVDPFDPAFQHPTKPIGPLYSKLESEQISRDKKWIFVQQESGYRRVVASPKPQVILGLQSIMHLLKHNVIVIAAGGGGIPVIKAEDKYKGAEAVIDKDSTSALLATYVAADCLIIATNVDAVYLDWDKPSQQPIKEITSSELRAMSFAQGSMGPKVEAACQFVEKTNKTAVIGSLEKIKEMAQGCSGTRIKASIT